MDSFIERLRWVDLVFVSAVAVAVILTARLAYGAWRKEKDKLGK